MYTFNLRGAGDERLEIHRVFLSMQDCNAFSLEDLDSVTQGIIHIPYKFKYRLKVPTFDIGSTRAS